MSDDDNRPSLNVTVQRESGEFSIKMTYGLEMDLRRVMPDAGMAMSLAMMDPETQDYIVRRCLTNTNKAIRDEKELVKPEEIDIDTADADKIIMWVLEHQLYFFGKRAAAVMELAARQKTKVPSHLTTAGSEDSPSPTPSAGPSESSKETSNSSSGTTPDAS